MLSLAVGASVALFCYLVWLGTAVLLGSRREAGPVIVGLVLFLAASFFSANALLLSGSLSGSVDEIPGPAVLIWVLSLAWGWVSAHVLRTPRRPTWALVVPFVGGLSFLAWDYRDPQLTAALLQGRPSVRLVWASLLLAGGPILALWFAQQARPPARPGLVAYVRQTSGALLALVGGATLWGLLQPGLSGALREDQFFLLANTMCTLIISLVVGRTGRAAVVYEHFTRRPPRWHLFQEMRRAEWASVGVGLLAALFFMWSETTLPAALVFGAGALFLHAYAAQRLMERQEAALLHLRGVGPTEPAAAATLRSESAPDRPFTRAGGPGELPFSELHPTGRSLLHLEHSFDAFCRAVLGVSALLVPAGSLFAVVGSLVSPKREAVEGGDFVLSAELRTQLEEAPPDREIGPMGPWAHAIRLCGAGGQSAFLLIGAKDRPISLQQLELSRAFGERLLEQLVTFHLSRTLTLLYAQLLQKAKLDETLARRTIHDELLPELHAATLAIAETGRSDLTEALSRVHRGLSSLLRGMASFDATLHGRPLVAAVGELVSRFGDLDIQYSCRISRSAVEGARADAVFFALREILENARRHAPGARLLVSVREGAQFELEVQSSVPTETRDSAPAGAVGAGTGQGLSIHSAMIALLGGSLAIGRSKERYRVTLRFPVGA